MSRIVFGTIAVGAAPLSVNKPIPSSLFTLRSDPGDLCIRRGVASLRERASGAATSAVGSSRSFAGGGPGRRGWAD